MAVAGTRDVAARGERGPCRSRGRPGCRGSAGRRVGLHPALEGLDDAHAPAAAGTRWEPIERFWRFDRLWRRRRHGKQFAGSYSRCCGCGGRKANDAASCCRTAGCSLDAVTAIRSQPGRSTAPSMKLPKRPFAHPWAKMVSGKPILSGKRPKEGCGDSPAHRRGMIVDREVTSGIEALLGGDALAAPFTRARRRHEITYQPLPISRLFHPAS